MSTPDGLSRAAVRLLDGRLPRCSSRPLPARRRSAPGLAGAEARAPIRRLVPLLGFLLTATTGASAGTACGTTPSVQVALRLPVAERAFEAGPDEGAERLLAFLRAHAGRTVRVALRVRRPAADTGSACEGNLRSPKAGTLFLRLAGNRLLVIARDPTRRPGNCRPTPEGFAYAGRVVVEPPPRHASLEAWTLREVSR